jgi:hypothetical protein
MLDRDRFHALRPSHDNSLLLAHTNLATTSGVRFRFKTNNKRDLKSSMASPGATLLFWPHFRGTEFFR